jgi:hypothetical protein
MQTIWVAKKYILNYYANSVKITLFSKLGTFAQTTQTYSLRLGVHTQFNETKRMMWFEGHAKKHLGCSEIAPLFWPSARLVFGLQSELRGGTHNYFGSSKAHSNRD